MRTMNLFNDTPSEVVRLIRPTITLCGEKGGGKTAIAIAPASAKAYRILARGLADSRFGTETDRQYIYTTRCTNHMDVEIRLKSKDIVAKFIRGIIVSTFEKIMDDGRGYRTDDSIVKALFKYVSDALSGCGVLNSLGEGALYEFCRDACTLCSSKVLSDFYDYQKSEDPTLREDILGKFNSCLDELYPTLLSVVGGIYDKLYSITGGTGDTISLKIDLDRPDERVVKALFGDNSPWNLTFEPLCELITIHVPMSSNMWELLRGRFAYRNGDYLEFAILDTKGLRYETDSDRVAHYLPQLGSLCDATVFVIPSGDTELFFPALKAINKALAGYPKERGHVCFLYSKADKCLKEFCEMHSVPYVKGAPYDAIKREINDKVRDTPGRDLLARYPMYCGFNNRIVPSYRLPDIRTEDYEMINVLSTILKDMVW